MIPYERIDNATLISSDMYLAKEALTKGWQRRGYEAIDLFEPIPWKLLNQQQRSHNFYIQSLTMVDILLRAHSHSKEKKYLEVSMSIVLDWVRNHSDQEAEGISPFAWYDMSVGLRAYRLAYLYEAASEANLLDDKSRQLMWQSLEQHASYLADDANIAFHNNHGYYQVAGQLAMGRRFAAQSAVMAQAQQQGLERLQRMLAQQFASDGVHREHSPDYHRMVYHTLMVLIEYGLVLDEKTTNFALIIEEALSWFVFPNQHIVNFGDSDDKNLARSSKESIDKWKTSEMRFWVSGGAIGEPSKDVVRTFTEGGYWIVRKQGDDPGVLQDYSYLAFNAAFHSRTHKHADDLSFVWFDRGSSILVDAGRYGYIGKTEQGSELWLDGHWYADPWRVFCESTRAHNALEFDDRNYLRKGRKPYGSAIQRWSEFEGIYAVDAEVKHFGSIRHMRLLVFKPAEWLIVYDWFKDNNESLHNVKQWFHLAPNLKLSCCEDGSLLVSGIDSPELLRIQSLLPASSPEIILAKEGERPQGWWSGREREIIPAYAFNYQLSDVDTGSLATLFTFAPSVANLEKSSASLSGRSLNFEWRSEHHIHTVNIKRENEKPLSIGYKLKRQ